MAPAGTNRSWFALLPLLLSLPTAAADDAAAGGACRAEAGVGSCGAAVAGGSLPNVSMLQTQTLHGTAMLMEHDLNLTDSTSDTGEMNVDVGGVTHKTPAVKRKPAKKARASDEVGVQTDTDGGRELLDEDETFTGAGEETDEEVGGEGMSGNEDGFNEVDADVGEMTNKKPSVKYKPMKKARASDEEGARDDTGGSTNYRELIDEDETFTGAGEETDQEVVEEDTSAYKDGSNEVDAEVGEVTKKKSSAKDKQAKKKKVSDEGGSFANHDEGANNNEMIDEGRTLSDAGGETEEETAVEDMSVSKDGSNEMDADVGEVTVKTSSGKSKPAKKAKVSDEDGAYADVEEGTNLVDEDETSRDGGGVPKVGATAEHTSSEKKDGSSDLGEDASEEEADKDKSANKASRDSEDDQDEEAAEDKATSSDEVDNFADIGEAETTLDDSSGREPRGGKDSSEEEEEEEGEKDTSARKASSFSAKAADSMASWSIDGSAEQNDRDKKGGKKKLDAGIASSKKGDATTSKTAKARRSFDSDDAIEKKAVTKQSSPKKPTRDQDDNVLPHADALEDRSSKAKKESVSEEESAVGQDENAALGAPDDEPAIVGTLQEDEHSKVVEKTTYAKEGDRKHGDGKKRGRVATRKTAKHQSYASRLFKTLLLEARKEIIDKSVKQTA